MGAGTMAHTSRDIRARRRAARHAAGMLAATLLTAVVAQPLHAASPVANDGSSIASQPSDSLISWSVPDLRQPQEVVGTATVIDGDTIEIRGQRIELYGIDAPEIGQTCKIVFFPWKCGAEAIKMLRALVADREVSCDIQGAGSHAPLAGVCSTQGGELNGTMVRIGMALAYRDQSLDYVADEAAAEREDVGVWQTRFDAPWEWRSAQRQ